MRCASVAIGKFGSQLTILISLLQGDRKLQSAVVEGPRLLHIGHVDEGDALVEGRVQPHSKTGDGRRATGHGDITGGGGFAKLSVSGGLERRDPVQTRHTPRSTYLVVPGTWYNKRGLVVMFLTDLVGGKISTYKVGAMTCDDMTHDDDDATSARAWNGQRNGRFEVHSTGQLPGQARATVARWARDVVEVVHVYKG